MLCNCDVACALWASIGILISFLVTFYWRIKTSPTSLKGLFKADPGIQSITVKFFDGSVICEHSSRYFLVEDWMLLNNIEPHNVGNYWYWSKRVPGFKNKDRLPDEVWSCLKEKGFSKAYASRIEAVQDLERALKELGILE